MRMLRAALHRRLRRAIREDGRWSLHSIGETIVHVVTFIGITAIAPMLHVGFSGWLLAQIVAHSAFVAIWSTQARKKLAPVLARTALSEGWCGSCGYCLEGLGAQQDGCLVCPECGAAWLGRRITKPVWHQPAVSKPTSEPGFVQTVLGAHASDRNLASDAHGRLVRVLDSRLRSLSDGEYARIDAERRRTIVREVRRVGLASRWVMATIPIVVAMLFFWLSISFAVSKPRVEPGVAIFLSLFAMFFAGVAAYILLGDGFIRPLLAARAFVRMGLCPSCGEDIAAGALDVDGLIHCPRCNSCWRPPDGESAPP
ncbi:MAG TPA: hypothetical protein VG797_10940 [Phycisphaerales bacterium]|nr:hypothetical protein [Phycisphaerales bacterium]